MSEIRALAVNVCDLPALLRLQGWVQRRIEEKIHEELYMFMAPLLKDSH